MSVARGPIIDEEEQSVSLAEPDPLEATPASAVASKISRFTTQAVTEFRGRGPTQVRTYVSDDALTVVLQGVLTKGERNLVDSDQEAAVDVGHSAYHDAMRSTLIAGVEGITGRTVRTMLSASEPESDVSVDVYLLVPADDGDE